MMIGRRLEEYFPSHARAEPGEELLRVERSVEPRGLPGRVVHAARR